MKRSDCGCYGSSYRGEGTEYALSLYPIAADKMLAVSDEHRTVTGLWRT